MSETDKLNTIKWNLLYERRKYNYKKVKDYNVGKNMFKDGIKAINPFKDKESGAMFFLDLAIDAYRGVANKLLESSLDNYKEVIPLEQEARNKCNVKTK